MAGGLQPVTLAPRLSLNGASAAAQSAHPDSVVTEFLRASRELVAAQREVVLGYLGAAPAPAARMASLAAPPPPGQLLPAEPVLPTGPEQIAAAVTAVISGRTGYPADMLGTDLDLEADLSIDSIKRTEIIAALAEQLGLSQAGAGVESVMEQLAQVKTISAITDWLTGHLGDGPAGGAAGANGGAVHGSDVAGGGQPSVAPARATDGQPRGARPRRFLVEDVDLAPAAGDLPSGGQFLIVDDGRGVALELAELLEQHGAQTVIASAPTEDELAGADALVHLGALRLGVEAVLPDGFAAIRAALAGGARALLLVTATGGTFGRERVGDPCDLGLRGLIKTIAAEYPGVLARAVDVAQKDSPRVIAAQLLAELSDRRGPAVAGYRAGQRVGLRVREAGPLPAVGSLGLDRDSVVLLTGGARGITASVALALARRAGCHIELIGRTPPPRPPDPQFESAAGDLAAIRRVLIERGVRDPREVEAGIGQVVREREIRATLAALRQTAASVRYHAVDVRDAAAVSAVIGDVYGRHGRLDGVIHGAGIVEDRLVRDKTPESFARVYATKVDGARALMSGLRDDIRFLVLFGSVSGVLGNRGQADYAAANDALDSIAHLLSTRLPGRVVAVDWGPWAGGGMITPELEREYARRGVTLIDPEEGAACLLAEITAGSGPAQVIYMCDEAPGD